MRLPKSLQGPEPSDPDPCVNPEASPYAASTDFTS